MVETQIKDNKILNSATNAINYVKETQNKKFLHKKRMLIEVLNTGQLKDKESINLEEMEYEDLLKSECLYNNNCSIQRKNTLIADPKVYNSRLNDMITGTENYKNSDLTLEDSESNHRIDSKSFNLKNKKKSNNFNRISNWIIPNSLPIGANRESIWFSKFNHNNSIHTTVIQNSDECSSNNNKMIIVHPNLTIFSKFPKEKIKKVDINHRNEQKYKNSGLNQKLIDFFDNSSNKNIFNPNETNEYCAKLLVSPEFYDKIHNLVSNSITDVIIPYQNDVITVSPKNLFFPGTKECTIFIKCEKFQKLNLIVRQIIKQIFKSKAEKRGLIKLAVPRRVVGTVIGKGGSHVQMLRQSSCCNIHISPLFVTAEYACSERIISISSHDLVAVENTVLNILNHVNKHPCRGICQNVIYYNENNIKPIRISLEKLMESQDDEKNACCDFFSDIKKFS